MGGRRGVRRCADRGDDRTRPGGRRRHGRVLRDQLHGDTIVLPVASALLLLVAVHRDVDLGRLGVPLALVASTIPHAFLVYHGAPIELARHAVVLDLVLMTSVLWLMAGTVDLLIALPGPAAADSAADDGDRDGR